LASFGDVERAMTATSRLSLGVIFGAALLASSCRQSFTEAVPQAEKVVLYEGLPHQNYESRLLEEERRTKAVQDLNGYPFYQEPLTFIDGDAKRVSKILQDSGSYLPFSGEKKCGGFHPDYAVEWHVGAERYRALLCFGCDEVKLFGPGLKSRHDMERDAFEELQQILKGYRKNRPSEGRQE
jgi:hypothetical protein